MVVAAAAGAVTPALAADVRIAPPLAQYSVATAAVPMSVIGANISGPPDPTHVAYTEARAETGGRSQAMASPVWTDFPGQRAAQRLHVPGADSLVAVRATHPDGPGRSATNLPGGPSAAATATGDAAFAAASASTSSVPGLAAADELAGQSQSSHDGDTVVGRGTATVGKLHVLGGLITIEGVLTRVRIVSDGVTAAVDGNTTVHRVVVAGAPASLTATGLGGLPAPIESMLADLGITVRLMEPADSISGGSGSRSVGGVLVHFDSTAARDVLDGRRAAQWATTAMPERLGAWVAGLRDYDHDVTMRFGQVAVSAAVGGAQSVVPAGDQTARSGPPVSVLSGVDDSPLSVTPSAVELAPDGEIAAGSFQRFVDIAGGAGIPATLIALAIVTAIAFAVPLARVVEEAAEIPPR